MRGLFCVAKKILREEGFLPFLNKGCRYILQLLSIPFCRRRIRGFNPPTFEQALNFSYDRFFGLIQPAQIREEITGLLHTLGESPPKKMMEIGTMNGGTLFLFARVATEDATLISVDLPWARFGYGYPRMKIPLYRSFVRSGQCLQMIRSDSHQRLTLEGIREILDGDDLDFLFLDGDHTYEGVKQDFQMYSPLVKPKGLIAFHDIAPHPPETGCDVFRFWQEIRETQHVIDEYVADWKQGWGGVGMIQT